uniref:Protein rtoA-like n=1 Tax=Diabrotica virgifera virgifera TaxID=50390 RepID=A0A6P7GIY5_DIAVI
FQVLLLAVSQSYSQGPYNYQRPSNPFDHSSSHSNPFSRFNNGPGFHPSTSVSVVPALSYPVNSLLDQGYNYPRPNGGFDSNLGSPSSNSPNFNSGGNGGYNYQSPNPGFLLPSATRNVNFNSGFNDGPSSGSHHSGSFLSSSSNGVNSGLNGGYNYPIPNSGSHNSGSLLPSGSQNSGSFLNNIPSINYGSPSLSGSLFPSASSNLNSGSPFNNVPSSNYGSPNLFSGDSRPSPSFSNNNGLFPGDSHSSPSFGPVPEQKHVYVYVAPPEPEAESKQLHIPAAPVNHKIIFIKAPSQSASRTHVVPLGADQEKTLVYVLVKKPEDPEVHLRTPAPTLASKPEVYFIRYKTEKDGTGAPSNGLPSVEDNRRGANNGGFDPSSSGSSPNGVSPVYGPSR